MFQYFVTIAKRFLMAGYPYTASFGSIGVLSKKWASLDPGGTDVLVAYVYDSSLYSGTM